MQLAAGVQGTWKAGQGAAGDKCGEGGQDVPEGTLHVLP